MSRTIIITITDGPRRPVEFDSPEELERYVGPLKKHEPIGDWLDALRFLQKPKKRRNRK